MNREIKFRVWYKEKKVMTKRLEMGQLKSFRVKDLEMLGKEIFLLGKCDLNEAFKDDKTVFLQYTGLKDKKGVEIYEGDIITTGGNELYLVVFGEGIFDSGYYKYTGFYLLVHSKNSSDEPRQSQDRTMLCEREIEDHRDFNVIGNMYENPELLDKKENTCNTEAN